MQIATLQKSGVPRGRVEKMGWMGFKVQTHRGQGEHGQIVENEAHTANLQKFR